MKAEFFQQKKQEFAGLELEEAYLGHPINWGPIYTKYGLNDKGKELSLNKWVDLFEKEYPLNPKSPEKKFGVDILYSTAAQLGIDVEHKDGPQELDFYSARGSGLDYRGIDCFLVYKNPKTKKRAIFTIDLTKREEKDKWKADRIVHELREDEYDDKMEKLTKEIAEKLKDRTEFVH